MHDWNLPAHLMRARTFCVPRGFVIRALVRVLLCDLILRASPSATILRGAWNESAVLKTCMTEIYLHMWCAHGRLYVCATRQVEKKRRAKETAIKLKEARPPLHLFRGNICMCFCRHVLSSLVSMYFGRLVWPCMTEICARSRVGARDHARRRGRRERRPRPRPRRRRRRRRRRKPRRR